MSLIIEDGSLVAGANSFVTAAEADTYHSARGNTTWATSASTTALKELYLLRACDYLCAHYRTDWKGTKVSTTQDLCWPRNSVMDEDGGLLASTTIPAPVKSAQCELALRALSAALAPDQDRGGMVSSQSVGPVSVTYMTGAPAGTSYTMVDDILSGLVNFSGGWGTIEKVRA